MSEDNIKVVLAELRSMREGHSKDMDHLRELFTEKLTNVVVEMTEMKVYQKEQNGNVKRNTAFRQRWSGVFVALGVLGTTVGIVGVFLNFF